MKRRITLSGLWRLLPWVLLGMVALALIGAHDYYFAPGSPRPVGQCTKAPKGEGWIDLLDADHARQWTDPEGKPAPFFEVRDGMLHIFGGIGPLKYATYTGASFDDFDLHLEFRLSPSRWFSRPLALALNPQMRCNSGVFLRVPERDSALRGFEVQVLDDYGWPAHKNGTGSIYDVVTPMFNMARPAGEWNSYDISLRGSRVVVVVNGWKVIDTDFAQMTEPIGKFKTPYAELPRSGRIALQDHGGELWYRNIRIRPVEAVDPATETVPVELPEGSPAGAVRAKGSTEPTGS